MADPEKEASDTALAQDARAGNKRAFGVLVERYQGPIYSFAMHFFRSSDIAEDVAQETFLRAYRFIQSYDHTRPFITWLYSIARNICIDRHREKARKDGIPLDDISPGLLLADHPDHDPLGVLERREAKVILKGAVDSLPEQYKTPIILCYMQGLSYQEIGDILGISLNNTKIRIFRAKKMLIERLSHLEEK